MANPVLRVGSAAFCVGMLAALLTGCSRPISNPGGAEAQSVTSNSAPVSPTSRLSAHIWRVTSSASAGFPGAIYMFVPDGTLLETSCKETYRIATWSYDAKSPQAFQVVEDGRVAFSAKILEEGPAGMRLERRLAHGETDELKLNAVAGEFVCPDLR
jgi:hypothetical protein